MMKKDLVLTLWLSLIFILSGCNHDTKTNNTIQDTNEKQTLEQESLQSTKIVPNKKVVRDNNNLSQKITTVNNTPKLHEGTYIDDKYYKQDLSKFKSYCEVEISNLTDTSFDFTIYKIDTETSTRNVIFLTHTATFENNKSTATFYGKNHTLTFAFPTITDIKINGFNPLEGKTYINNTIPECKLYEGTYWDERCFGGDAYLDLKSYCEVEISNVTNTSFDFTVYEVDRRTQNRKVIFLTHTAMFENDGSQAVFYGKDYTLTFTFPYITHIRISGFKPLEGRDYMNNRIPGHECS